MDDSIIEESESFEVTVSVLDSYSATVTNRSSIIALILEGDKKSKKENCGIFHYLNHAH